MRKCVNWLIVAAVGILIIIVAVIFNLWILPMLVHYQVGKTMALNNGTDAWDMFQLTPIPIYLQVYFFNVTNPVEMMNGQKPVLQELGPYIYKEHREKTDLKINEENDSIFYRQNIKYEFDAEASHPRKDTDRVMPINFLIHLVSNLMVNLKYLDIADELLDMALPELLGDLYAPTLNTTVNEVLFGGIELKCNNTKANVATKIVCSSIKHFPGLKLIQQNSYGNFEGCVFGYKNSSDSGLFEINRGVKDFTKLGEILSWNGKKSMDVWGGEKCNQISGYDETLLPPFITTETSIKLYNTDFCGSVNIIYSGGANFEGISGYRFTFDSSFMGDVRDYPENYCYCPQSIEGITEPNGCLYKGALDISSCQNLPAIISLPHFLGADEHYQSQIGGLHPDKDLHQTFIDIEPTTGVPLQGVKRMQLNVFSRQTSALKLLKHQVNALIPVLWFEEKAQLGDKEIAMLRDQLLRVLNIADITKWVFIAFGLLMMLTGLVMAFIRSKKVHNHPD